MTGFLNILLAQGPTASGATRFVATEGNTTSTVWISDDALKWTAVDTGISKAWNTVIYMDNVNRFVIFGGFSAATNQVAYSDDGGLTWTGVNLPVTAAFNDGFVYTNRQALYNPVLELAVASGNRANIGVDRIFYSSDGINWSQGNYASGQSDQIRDFAYRPSDGAMVGAGDSFVDIFRNKWYSSDGITWNSDGGNSGSSAWGTCVYISTLDRFVVLDTPPSRYAFTDDAGATWPTDGSIVGPGSPGTAESLVTDLKTAIENPFNPGEIIFADGGGSIFTSTDSGATAVRRASFAQRISTIVYNGTDTLVGVGNANTGNGRVVSSTDGYTWAEGPGSPSIIPTSGAAGFYGLTVALNHPFSPLP